MSGEILVKVEGVKKKFCRSLKKSLWYGVQDMAAEITGCGRTHDRLRPDEFWALNDVAFELKRGECLGLIGRNGAGKTTLLKILNGLIKPDGGRVEMRGRVGALIALGAGFNPILTGRENIYVNGSVLGLTRREIDAKIEEIIEFAEIAEFINSPVQSYSSGMQVRLGFAVATALEPDVLILDEVLAVGDASFRTKCFVRIASLLSQAAVIFVSHSEEQLSRICSAGLLLEHGGVAYAGELRACLAAYREKQPASVSSPVPYHDEAVRQADLKISVTEHVSGQDLPLEIHYQVRHPIQLSLHVLTLVDPTGNPAAACDLLPWCRHLPNGATCQRFTINALSLRPGIYTFSLEALSVNHGSVMVRKHFLPQLRVSGSIGHWCNYTPTTSLTVFN